MFLITVIAIMGGMQHWTIRGKFWFQTCILSFNEVQRRERNVHELEIQSIKRDNKFEHLILAAGHMRENKEKDRELPSVNKSLAND